MGTSVAPGAAVGTAVVGVAVTAGAEVATALVAVGWAVVVAAGALADCVTAPTADDAPELQADSASATPRPRAETPAILVTCVKYLKFIVVPLSPAMDQA
jgi:hypothetical protein